MTNGNVAMAQSGGINRDYEAASEKLIVALDVPTIGEAQAIVDALDGVVSFFKIGLHLQMARGMEAFMDDLVRAKKRVFLDYKYGDIPETVRGGVAGAAERNIDFLTVQGNGEITKDVLRAAVEGKRNGLPKIFFVTLLTSIGQDDLDVLGVRSSVENIVRARTQMALDVGLDGIISSGREAKLIREMDPEKKLLIITPGIRMVGAVADDHKRPTTPEAAIRAGSDYLVVGRPIVKAEHPKSVALVFRNQIADALANI